MRYKKYKILLLIKTKSIMKQMILTAALVMGIFSFAGVEMNAQTNDNNVSFISKTIISQDDFKEVKAEELSAVIQEKLKVYAQSNEITALAYSQKLDLVRVVMTSITEKTETTVYLDKDGNEVQLPVAKEEKQEEQKQEEQK